MRREVYQLQAEGENRHNSLYQHHSLGVAYSTTEKAASKIQLLFMILCDRPHNFLPSTIKIRIVPLEVL